MTIKDIVDSLSKDQARALRRLAKKSKMSLEKYIYEVLEDAGRKGLAEMKGLEEKEAQEKKGRLPKKGDIGTFPFAGREDQRIICEVVSVKRGEVYSLHVRYFHPEKKRIRRGLILESSFILDVWAPDFYEKSVEWTSALRPPDPATLPAPQAGAFNVLVCLADDTVWPAVYKGGKWSILGGLFSVDTFQVKAWAYWPCAPISYERRSCPRCGKTNTYGGACNECMEKAAVDPR